MGVNDSFSGRMAVSKAFPPDMAYRCSGNGSYCQSLPGLNSLGEERACGVMIVFGEEESKGEEAE